MKRILVFGDAISDVYSDYTFKKMCPDNLDVPAAVLRDRMVYPGGAANVAVNVAALSPNTRVDLVASIDAELARQIKFASKNRVNMDFCHDGFVIVKERVSIGGQSIARLDSNFSISTATAGILNDALRSYFDEHDPDIIILSDYAAGALNEESLNILRPSLFKTLVDTKVTDLSVFGGKQKSLGVKLNWPEYKAVRQAGDHSPERHFGFLVVTEGANGAVLKVRRDDGPRSITHTLGIDAHKVNAVDTCGCGDTFIAGLAASMLSNDDPYTAMQFANAAAATVVTQPRTAVADLEKTMELVGRGKDEAR